jgi:hypothetical protein
LARLPADATHLVVSAGGNNALVHSNLILHEPAISFVQVLRSLAEIQEEFQAVYRRMLQTVLAQRRPTAVCTVYDRIPGIDEAEKAGLCLFNDVIFREAFRMGVPVVDLRLVCAEASDYAKSSPIEPSVAGGGKIARAIVRLVTTAGRPEGNWVIT